MQRRAGKAGQAHISLSPPTVDIEPMSPTVEKMAQLNKRSLGMSYRIWVILALFLTLVIFTHYILPSSGTDHVYSNSNLKPKNYLNVSEETPNPFDFCPVHGPGDEVGAKHGARILSQSRLHLGSGARIQRLLHRALAGQPVTISVIGGSVSACHGSGDDPISSTCYPSRFFQWWNTVFPNPASELTNGAMRRADSAYFGYCNAHHIPDVTDLVIVELDTDDIPDQGMMDHFEVLIRSILLRPDQPAVLLLGHFSPQIHQTYGFAGPDHWHTVVAQFYDVPHISIKHAVFTDYMQNSKSIDKYFVDPVLASPQGHELITDVLVAYFQTEICNAWGVFTGASYDTSSSLEGQSGESHGLFGGVGQRKGVPEPGKADKPRIDADGNRAKEATLRSSQINIPLARINTRPNAARPFEEISPFCVSANDLINPLPPSLFFGSGWSAFHPTTGSSSLQTKAHYWFSTAPSSRLRIPISIGAGDVGIYYLREPISQIGEGSAVECWVDDNYGGARVIENAADIGEPTPSLEMIDHYVGRGSHFVECQLLGEEGQSVTMFKIIGIFAT